MNQCNKMMSRQLFLRRDRYVLNSDLVGSEIHAADHECAQSNVYQSHVASHVIFHGSCMSRLIRFVSGVYLVSNTIVLNVRTLNDTNAVVHVTNSSNI